jgi:hypothetical protein
MIRLNRVDNGQRFAVTVSELTTIPDPVYLFHFIHDSTNKESVVILADISPNKARCNIFQIDGSLFSMDGWYSYRIHQQNSATNTDVFSSGDIVERGRLYVEALGAFNFIEPSDGPGEFIEFEPGDTSPDINTIRTTEDGGTRITEGGLIIIS